MNAGKPRPAFSLIPIILAAVVPSLFVTAPSAFAQGSLTPPGPPGPTMKTASQIEPRTPISIAPFFITQPGSYYLTANSTVASGNAIYISTNQVTLDLNGFTISSTDGANSGSGIWLNNGTNADITILNGHITGGVTNNGSGVFSGPGFANGVSYAAGNPGNVRVTGVSVSGCLAGGINVGAGNGTFVESCTVQSIGGVGIVANVISHCTAMSCGNTAIIAAIVSDSNGRCIGSTGSGINASFAANNSSGQSIGGDGVYLYTGVANNCSGQSATGNGVIVVQGIANGCFGSSGSGTGINIVSGAANNCYGASVGNNGIYINGPVHSSYGQSLGSANGIGVNGPADNCYGQTATGIGIVSYGYNVVIGCIGVATSPSGGGLLSYIANSSSGQINQDASDAETIDFKYNMK